MTGIWGASSNDVYVARGSASEALHWDGSTLTSIPFAQANKITGSGPNDIWVAFGTSITHVGALGVAAQQVYSARNELLSIWASGSNDVYAVGRNGMIVHGHAR